MSKNEGNKKLRKTRRRRIILIAALVLIIAAAACRTVSNEEARAVLEKQSVSAELVNKNYDSTDVALVRSSKENAADITDAEVRQMVREAVALAGGLDGIVSDGDFVVLKPNLIAAKSYAGSMFSAMRDGDGYSDESRYLPQKVNGIATDYRIIKAVSELVRELNPSGRIYLMETSGWGNTPRNMEIVGWTKANLPEVDEILTFDETGGDYSNINTDDMVAVDLGDRKIFTDDVSTLTKGLYYIDKTYYSADVVISLPVLKSHMNAAVTGAVKNVAIGTAPILVYSTGSGTPYLNRMSIDHGWESINKFIHDFYLVKPVDFVVTDGLQGTENGPVAMGARSLEDAQKNMRLILAGSDAVAVDTIHSYIIGMDAQKVDYLHTLAADNAGIADPSRINVVGNASVAEVKKPFGVPGFPMTLMYPEPRHKNYEDFTAPVVSVENFAKQGGTIKADIKSDKDLIKIDVFIDGKLAGSSKGQGMSVKLDYSDQKLLNASKVEIQAYDKYLNSSRITL